MTNREKYKQTFSAIKTSCDFSMEEEKMKRIEKKNMFKTAVAVVAVCILISGSGMVAYAADIGGIQRVMQLWIHGDQTNVTVHFDADGSYDAVYTDGDGNQRMRGGGGIEILPDGSERPLSEEELLEHLTAPEVEYEDDGTVWLYWYNQKVDITDKFENKVCYVKLVGKEETMYVTVKYHGGYSYGPHKFAAPDSWMAGDDLEEYMWQRQNQQEQ